MYVRRSENFHDVLCTFNLCHAQKMKFSVKDLVTFTEENLNGKLHFLRSVSSVQGLKKEVLNLF